MIKDRRVVLRMNLLQLKFRNKNSLVKMYTFVFISIKHMSEAFFLKTRLIRTHGMSHWCPYYLVSTVVVIVVTTWGRGRTRSGNGSGRCNGNGSGSGSVHVDGGRSVSGGAWW